MTRAGTLLLGVLVCPYIDHYGARGVAWDCGPRRLKSCGSLIPNTARFNPKEFVKKNDLPLPGE